MTIAEMVALLRSFLIDLDSVNILWEFEEESGDAALQMYLMMALGSLNAVPPHVGNFGITDFPMPALLIHAATLECLRSNSIFQARNDINYNNSGISVKAHDGQRYNTQLQYMASTVEREMVDWKTMKISINCQGAFGGTWSPYATLNGRRPV